MHLGHRIPYQYAMQLLTMAVITRHNANDTWQVDRARAAKAITRGLNTKHAWCMALVHVCCAISPFHLKASQPFTVVFSLFQAQLVTTVVD